MFFMVKKIMIWLVFGMVIFGGVFIFNIEKLNNGGVDIEEGEEVFQNQNSDDNKDHTTLNRLPDRSKLKGFKTDAGFIKYNGGNESTEELIRKGTEELQGRDDN